MGESQSFGDADMSIYANLWAAVSFLLNIPFEFFYERF